MALWFHMRVNDDVIGLVDIQRLSPPAPLPSDDTLCHYRYVVETRRDGRFTGELDHVYSDGALSLIQKVLERVSSKPRRNAATNNGKA